MGGFQVGWARVCITPPVGIWMSGYASRTRGATDVHDDLYANAVVFSDGKSTAAVLAFDVLAFDLQGVEKIKLAAADATGLPVGAILTNTSHTHAGPAVMSEGKFPGFDETYFNRLMCAAVEATRSATDDLTPAVVAVGAAPVDIGCNRRERTSQGEIILGLNRDGPRLAEVAVWHVRRAEAHDLVLFSIPVHGTTMGGENLTISSEWMGAAVREIEAGAEGLRAVFLQGCCGNQNPYRHDPTLQGVARHSRTAAGAVAVALSHAREVPATPVVSVARRVELPFQDKRRAGYPCPLHGLRLGEAAAVGLGGEPFVEYALYGRSISPFRSTLMLGYTDGAVGYLPVRSAYEEGGYEVGANEWFESGRPWDPSLEDILKREIEKMLQDLRRSAGVPV